MGDNTGKFTIQIETVSAGTGATESIDALKQTTAATEELGAAQTRLAEQVAAADAARFEAVQKQIASRKAAMEAAEEEKRFEEELAEAERKSAAALEEKIAMMERERMLQEELNASLTARHEADMGPMRAAGGAGGLGAGSMASEMQATAVAATEAQAATGGMLANVAGMGTMLGTMVSSHFRRIISMTVEWQEKFWEKFWGFKDTEKQDAAMAKEVEAINKVNSELEKSLELRKGITAEMERQAKLYEAEKEASERREKDRKDAETRDAKSKAADAALSKEQRQFMLGSPDDETAMMERQTDEVGGLVEGYIKDLAARQVKTRDLQEANQKDSAMRQKLNDAVDTAAARVKAAQRMASLFGGGDGAGRGELGQIMDELIPAKSELGDIKAKRSDLEKRGITTEWDTIADMRNAAREKELEALIPGLEKRAEPLQAELRSLREQFPGLQGGKKEGEDLKKLISERDKFEAQSSPDMMERQRQIEGLAKDQNSAESDYNTNRETMRLRHWREEEELRKRQEEAAAADQNRRVNEAQRGEAADMKAGRAELHGYEADAAAKLRAAAAMTPPGAGRDALRDAGRVVSANPDADQLQRVRQTVQNAAKGSGGEVAALLNKVESTLGMAVQTVKSLSAKVDAHARELEQIKAGTDADRSRHD